MPAALAIFRKVCSFTVTLFSQPVHWQVNIHFNSTMEQLHADPTDPDKAAGNPGEESLSEYIQKMETEENLRKLAAKLKGGFVTPDESTPEKSAPDLSFAKFSKKLNRPGGQ